MLLAAAVLQVASHSSIALGLVVLAYSIHSSIAYTLFVSLIWVGKISLDREQGQRSIQGTGRSWMT